ncbi:MAG: PmoA family protein [Armatimonadota bacterium]|nr:PmoA family protein [Armatimonadota bacterium]
MHALSRTLAASLIVLASIRGVACFGSVELRRDLTYRAEPGYVDVMKGDKLIARYVYKDTPKPYIYPLFALDGTRVTRGYPMENISGEAIDHPHHRSFWVGFGNVNGIDFWSENEKSGKIVHKFMDFDSPSPGHWNIHTINEWVGPDGTAVCIEDRRYSFVSCDYGLLVSITVEMTGASGDLKFGSTKEGFVAFRVAQGMQLKDGKGSIKDSEGRTGTQCWGKRARWCDYTGEVDGKTVGITMFDVPSNYGYPTYWHVRDYGLFAANPFGGKEFTGDEKQDTGLVVPRGKKIRFVYIALIHQGELDSKTLDVIADEIAGKPPAKPKQP